MHTIMNAFSGVAAFVRMTAAKEHDKHFLYHLYFPANSRFVFDRAYHHDSQFAKFIEQKVWFVTRMKRNAATKMRLDKPYYPSLIISVCAPKLPGYRYLRV